MSRKRAHIPYPERLAAALACLLPAAQRDELRRRRVPAKDVIALFHDDHIVLHAFGGADEWWNIDPKLVATHREKSRGDTAIVAKAVRVRDREAIHQARRNPDVAAEHLSRVTLEKNRKPGRRIPARVDPWPQGRKLQGRNKLKQGA